MYSEYCIGLRGAVLRTVGRHRVSIGSFKHTESHGL